MSTIHIYLSYITTKKLNSNNNTKIYFPNQNKHQIITLLIILLTNIIFYDRN